MNKEDEKVMFSLQEEVLSDAGITKEELKKYPKRVHEVLGGDITADPLPLSDADYLAIYEKSYR